MCVCVCLCEQVLENYNKGKTALLSAAKIMVSPTEVDLNAETIFMGASTTSHQPTPIGQHRRNSSVRLVRGLSGRTALYHLTHKDNTA